MNRTQRLFAVTLLCASTSGCGTLLTRGQGAFVGAYPFEAVVADGGMILGMFELDQEMWIVFGLVSLPLDLAVDTVLAPLDVIAWVASRDKSRDRVKERARAEAASREPGAPSDSNRSP